MPRRLALRLLSLACKLPSLLAPLGLLGLLGLQPAAAHPGHVRPGGLYLAFKIEPERVRGGLNLPEAVLARLLKPRVDLGCLPSEEVQGRLHAAALEVLEASPLQLDGRSVTPTVDRVDLVLRVPPVALRQAPAVSGLHLNSGPFPALQIRFHLPAASVTSLGVRWTLPALLGGEDPAVGGVVVVGEHPEPFHLSAEEPAFTWHAPRSAPRPTITLTPGPAPPPRLPVVWGLGVLAGLGVVARARGRRRLLALAATGLFAVGARDWRPLDLPAWWGGGGRPGAEAARQIHRDLLRKAYAAFEAGDDAAAYDALARAVDGPLLEWLYGRLYEGLVLREEGGAVAQVTALDVLAADIEPPPGDDPADASFRVLARWQVVGEVRHFGHVHRRTQRYSGRFTVAPRAPGWRIVDLELLDQSRVDTQPAEDLLESDPGP